MANKYAKKKKIRLDFRSAIRKERVRKFLTVLRFERGPQRDLFRLNSFSTFRKTTLEQVRMR